MKNLSVKSFGADSIGLKIGQGVALGTPILTLDGTLPVEFLTPGDRILTRGGARRLHGVDVTVVRNARVIRIAHDTLGVDRPSADILVTPDQPIFIRDWRARALCGTATAQVAAARLVDGEYIRVETMAEARFYTLRFDGDAVIYAGGLELSCASESVTA
jgi:hypothetical protein